MIHITFCSGLLQTLIIITLLNTFVFGQEAQDLVNGNLIQFNDNGAWCWYQDERAVVDIEKGKIIIGSVASSTGSGGAPRSGDVDAVIFDLTTMMSKKYLLKNGGGNAFYCDDHNAPAFLVRLDGKYLAVYAAHFNDTTSYYRIYHEDEWGPEQRFNWKQERPGGSNFQTTYSNLYHLPAEGRTYNFVRGNNKSPNSMVSTDLGDSWTYGGQLASGSNIGYNNGYYKYSGNGFDRIDFVCTEYHPRDYNTSIYHGYIKDGRSYQSDGTLVDANILDVDFIPDPGNFTTVFEAGTVINGMTMYRCWNIDVQYYDDGTVATIISARINNNQGGGNNSINPDHAFIYCRYNGAEWSYSYLGEAGLKLYSSEQDYTGLAAMHPKDPNTIYISTTVDPRDNSNLGAHEIFKGVTNDEGGTWEWFPITWNSVRDNLRPIIPAWDENHTVLLWWRGAYFSAQRYDAAVVGIIDNKKDTAGLMTHIDADTINTKFASGAPLEFTGPSRDKGAADNKWHLRYGFGNGNLVFASGEIGGEDAPVLKTELTLTGEGIYDVWVNFWANPDYDWRIEAGLSEENMQLFRQMACKQVEKGDHNSTITLSDDGNTFLYQAYLGRIQASSNDSLNIFVDDETIQNGTSNTMVGDVARTWYDGMSYAKVAAATAVAVAENKTLPHEFSLGQNYPNPFNFSTTISYTLAHNADVRLQVYNLMGQEIATLADGEQSSGTHRLTWYAQNMSSGMYLIKISDDNQSKIKKMMLLR